MEIAERSADGASARARAIGFWAAATFSPSRDGLRVNENRWQNRVARWIVRVSRVSIQRVRPSPVEVPSGSRVIGPDLPVTSTATASPDGFHAARTSAQEGLPARAPVSGRAELSRQVEQPAPGPPAAT